MKLEIGMYVRTKQGELGKVISNEMIEFPKDYAKIEYLLIGNEITKASHNIIDLIEVGDYVNGLPVCTNYWKSDNKWHLEIPDSRLISNIALEQVNIQSIVTKQQIESMQYEVK